MLYADNQHITDPRLNLALEEYLLRHVPTAEAILLFYVNEPSVILGRNQNALEELDPDYTANHNVHVVRRLSGGGAVFHDLGNLNFSFITNGSRDLHNFQRFTEPVIRVLNQLGVPAALHGKSDIYVAGRKISGNAQYLARDRMVSHGTILFDSDLEALLRALNPRQVQIESKAVQSIRAKVGNVKEWLPEMDTAVLRQTLLTGIFAGRPVDHLPLSADDWTRIHQIKTERYDTWEWNIGRSPRFSVQRRILWGQTEIEARVEVVNGRIQQVSFSESLQPSAGRGLQAHLIGRRYDRANLSQALHEFSPAYSTDNLPPTALLLDLLY
ncbi:MAG: lipoate--protein ligase [Chloroflexi bacterium]|nr:lipoate--protein ligase [Chloroflexota bacterium]